MITLRGGRARLVALAATAGTLLLMSGGAFAHGVRVRSAETSGGVCVGTLAGAPVPEIVYANLSPTGKTWTVEVTGLPEGVKTVGPAFNINFSGPAGPSGPPVGLGASGSAVKSINSTTVIFSFPNPDPGTSAQSAYFQYGTA
jgi:hypothetical protein